MQDTTSLSQLFEELKRRNVFRVAIAYLAVAWLVLQVSDIVLDNIAAPDWLMKALMFFLAIGFPIAVLFAWAYEMTPEGIKREKDVDRSQSITGQTGQKLNRTIIAVLVAAVAFLLADKFVLQDATPDAAVTDKSVAVLPFVAMSRGEDDEYFADGLTEEILNSLTRVPELLVTARTSAFFFKGKDIPVPEIAGQLGVAHVVEGSVRRDGDRLRVTAQLIRAADGFHLWSKNYDRETADTFGVQTDIAEEISSALGVVLDDELLAQMSDAGVRDPAAFIALQKASEAFDNAHEMPSVTHGLLEANKWYDRALEIEPGIAGATYSRSDRYMHFLLDSVDNPDVQQAEMDAAYEQLIQGYDNAIRIVGDSPDRLGMSLDLALLSGSWRSFPPILSELAGMSRCTSTAWADTVSAPYGNAVELAAIGKRLAECNPLHFHGWRWHSLAQIWSGDPNAAVQTAQRGFELRPHVRLAQQMFFGNLAAGRPDNAEQVISRYIRDESQVLMLRETLAASQGDLVRAQGFADRFEETGAHRPIGSIASLAFRGMRDEANKQAAEIDAHPYGYLHLMLVPAACYCGAPWDLEFTPNFAKLLQDAELAWPPASPINWPLKDW
jgi:TolB-like protein